MKATSTRRRVTRRERSTAGGCGQRESLRCCPPDRGSFPRRTRSFPEAFRFKRARIEGHDQEGSEQLLRYAARPAFSEVQLSLLEEDVVELELKSPTASGQRVVHLHPVQFLRRLAYLIPPSGQNQVRYYKVFAPTLGLRAEVVPKPVELAVVQDDEADDAAAGGCSADRYRVAWAKVFDVDAERCPACGGRLRPVGAVTRREEARAALVRHNVASDAHSAISIRSRSAGGALPLR